MNVVETFVGQGDIRWLPKFCESRGIEARTVLHIGGHDGEETPIYQAMHAKKIVYVEPDVSPALQDQLRFPEIEIVGCAVGTGNATRGWVRMPNTHQSHLAAEDGTFDPRRYVQVTPLGFISNDHLDANILVVDTSGNELDVLKSGPLEQYDAIIVETDDSGVHASRTEDVRTYMYGQGRTCVQRWTHGGHSYGDEVYVRA